MNPQPRSRTIEIVSRISQEAPYLTLVTPEIDTHIEKALDTRTRLFETIIILSGCLASILIFRQATTDTPPIIITTSAVTGIILGIMFSTYGAVI